MVSGSDTHGTPITVRADEEGRRPEDVVAEFHESILETWEGIGHLVDTFTTTMTDNHRDVTTTSSGACSRTTTLHRHAGAVYDAEAKRYLPDRYIEGTCHTATTRGARGDQCDACGRQLDATDLIDPRSRTTGATPELRSSEHYFLRLPDSRSSLRPGCRRTRSTGAPT